MFLRPLNRFGDRKSGSERESWPWGYGGCRPQQDGKGERLAGWRKPFRAAAAAIVAHWSGDAALLDALDRWGGAVTFAMLVAMVVWLVLIWRRAPLVTRGAT